MDIGVKQRSPREHGQAAQYLYLIGTADKRSKIGISKSPKRRRSQLQTSTPVALTLHGQWRFGAGRAAEVESYLKRTFEELKISGEWFDIWPDVMGAAIATLHPDHSNKSMIPIAVAYALAEREERRLQKMIHNASQRERSRLIEEYERLQTGLICGACWRAGFRPNPWDEMFADDPEPPSLRLQLHPAASPLPAFMGVE